MSTTQSMVDFWGAITESKRIINAHSRHFLALSVLFLLPLSFSLTVFPTLFHTLTSPAPNRIVSSLFFTLTPFHHHLNHQTLIFSLLFSGFILVFSLFALCSVTYSVFHGFYGRPVKFLSSIRSVFSSFLPLLATFITAQIVVFLVLALFGMIAFLGIKGFVLIGGDFSYNSVYPIGLSLIWLVLLGTVLIHVGVSWYLMGVIVVVESKWGFEPMARSKALVRGMRWVALSLMLFFGFFVSVLIAISMVSSGVDSGSVKQAWAFVLRVVVTCAVLTMIFLHSIAASTVLYMYCKALHGELAGEIASEFAAEYVSLPFDDKKVPHIVYYVQ